MTGSAEALSELPHTVAVAKPLVGSGSLCASVPIMGMHVVICYELNSVEDERRRAQGVGAIQEIETLDLLLGLPPHWPIPIKSMTHRERDALESVPPGVIDVGEGYAIRRALMPLTVGLALVPVKGWRKGLEKAGRFAPHCQRVIALDRRPRDIHQLQVQASYYGIGAVVASDDRPEILVWPAPFQRHRITPTGWRFVEDVYRHIR